MKWWVLLFVVVVGGLAGAAGWALGPNPLTFLAAVAASYFVNAVFVIRNEDEFTKERGSHEAVGIAMGLAAVSLTAATFAIQCFIWIILYFSGR